MDLTDKYRQRAAVCSECDIDWSEFSAGLYPASPLPSLTNPLDRFKSLIISGDGHIIPLAGTTAFKEELSLTVRFGHSQEREFCLIDIFAGSGTAMHPIGHYDWEIQTDFTTGKEYAYGNKNRHQQLPEVIPAHAKADAEWSSYAFAVKDLTFEKIAEFHEWQELIRGGLIESYDELRKQIYQGHGIGKLMIAVSAIVLGGRGFTELELGSLSTPAQKAWRSYYPEVDDVPPRIPTSDISSHPLVDTILLKFLSPNI